MRRLISYHLLTSASSRGHCELAIFQRDSPCHSCDAGTRQQSSQRADRALSHSRGLYRYFAWPAYHVTNAVILPTGQVCWICPGPVIQDCTTSVTSTTPLQQTARPC